jgi:putative transposase
MEPKHKLRKVYNAPGHAHELTFSCYRRLPLLGHDVVRAIFLSNLDKTRLKWNFHVWAYVLMPEHVHLMSYPRDEPYDISRILLAIKKPVAFQALKRLEIHHPHTFRRLQVPRSDGGIERRFWEAGGGYDRNVHSGEAAWKMIAYIHRNPVRRELVGSPEDWKWSSAAFYAGRDPFGFVPDRCEWWVS